MLGCFEPHKNGKVENWKSFVPGPANDTPVSSPCYVPTEPSICPLWIPLPRY